MSEPALAEEQRDDERDERRAGVRQTASIGILVIIVVLIFLLLWDPFGESRSTTVQGRYPGIVGAIEDLPPSDDYIGVWLRPGNRIEVILSRHGLPEDGIVFQQEKDGYYVISAGERDVAATVKELKSDSALYDAGRVYEEDAGAKP